MASCVARASNLLGAVLNGSLVIFLISSATFISHPTSVLNPVPTAVPP